MQKVVRINKTIREILLVFGDDAEFAIKAMAIRIDGLERELEKVKAVADSLQVSQKNSPDLHGEVFWKQMETCVTKSLQLVTSSNTTFQPAGKLIVTSASGKVSVTPVKTYGKIDESEKLAEPVGRQGRDVR